MRLVWTFSLRLVRCRIEGRAYLPGLFGGRPKERKVNGPRKSPHSLRHPGTAPQFIPFFNHRPGGHWSRSLRVEKADQYPAAEPGSALPGGLPGPGADGRVDYPDDAGFLTLP